MVESIQDVVVRLDRDQGAVDAAATRVEAVRGVAEELLGRFAELGVTDGASVSALRQAMDTLAQSRSGLVDMAATVESAKRIVAATEWSPGGPPSSGGGKSEEVSTQPEPVSGQELLDQSEESSTASRYGQVMSFLTRKGDDVGDSVLKPASELVYTAKVISDADQQPPEFKNTTTSTQVASGPQIDSAPPMKPGQASAFVGVLAASILAVKGGEVAAKSVNRLWRMWK